MKLKRAKTLHLKNDNLKIASILLFYIGGLLLIIIYHVYDYLGIILLHGYETYLNCVHIALLSVPLITPNKMLLTKAEKKAIVIPSKLNNILIGLILGDLSCVKNRANARFRFKQSTIHEDYLRLLYSIFYLFCGSGPKINHAKPHPKTGKVYSSIEFTTYRLPCLTELYNLFYINNVKVIPRNIADLLTPIGLAYWIADDGSWNAPGRYVVLCTDSFTLGEVELLITALNTKFLFNCYKVKNGNKKGTQYRIVIPAVSVPRLRELIADDMPCMMKYKLGQ